MLTTVAVILVSLVVVSQGQTTTTASSFTIPTGAALDKIVAGSFANIDSNNDSFVEKWEFDSFIIVADTNNDGCMDLSEYQGFSAGGSTIATKIFKYFDPTNTNCITVDKVYGEFYKMDSDDDGKVDMQEFEQYYLELLNTLFAQPAGPVG